MLSPELARAAILVVDDEPSNVELLEMILADEGYTRVVSVGDSRQAAERYDEVSPDLVLLDLHMPHQDGFAVMRRLRERASADEFVPILVLTADVTPQAKLRALSEGATDFLTKPLDAVEVGLRIRNLLETRVLYLGQRAARARAEAGERRARFLAEASRVLSASFDQQTTLATLARVVVPELADYCVIDAEGPDGETVRIGAAHADPARERLLRESVGLWGGAIPRGHELLRGLTEGQFVLLEEVPPGLLEAPSAPEEVREAVARLAPRSLMSIPMVSGGHVLGSLTLVASDSGRRYGSDDLATAEELARRAALAIENAKLFRGAQEAMQARDDVLAVVAHDLRNPLSTIRMAAEMLLESAEPVQRRPAEIIHRSAERANRLIQDLLEVTRIERGKLSLDLRPDALDPLLDEAVAMLRPLATARSVALEKETPTGLPKVVMDGTRILQVISNLVGNAIKFTPEGGRITVRAEPAEGEVRVAVADTGQGISPEQLPHVFGRFWQASDADQRGIGLGLSIARGIAEAHGGRIWVESTLGEGTTFYFTLPDAQAGAGERQARAAAVATAG
ncbi:MAG TPA: ATP-binding protein [Longimicrobiaceae bacterium]|nr:ATP-binding protein [Longimicrobiaceae bacterium]